MHRLEYRGCLYRAAWGISASAWSRSVLGMYRSSLLSHLPACLQVHPVYPLFTLLILSPEPSHKLLSGPLWPATSSSIHYATSGVQF